MAKVLVELVHQAQVRNGQKTGLVDATIYISVDGIVSVKWESLSGKPRGKRAWRDPRGVRRRKAILGLPTPLTPLVPFKDLDTWAPVLEKCGLDPLTSIVEAESLMRLTTKLISKFNYSCYKHEKGTHSEELVTD